MLRNSIFKLMDLNQMPALFMTMTKTERLMLEKGMSNNSLQYTPNNPTGHYSLNLAKSTVLRCSYSLPLYHSADLVFICRTETYLFECLALQQK